MTGAPTMRTKTNSTPNAKDAETVAKGARVVGEDPPEVAGVLVLRAERTADVNTMPFLVLGLLYVINGASVRMAWIIFGGFTVARLAHTEAALEDALLHPRQHRHARAHRAGGSIAHMM